MAGLRVAWLVLRRLGRACRRFVSWTIQSWRTVLVCLVIGNVLVIADHEAAGVVVFWLVPAWNLIRAVWEAVSPLTYETALGGPLRRRAWRRRVRKGWDRVAERCGLASRRNIDEPPTISRLLKVQTSGNTLTLRVRAAAGQTVDDLDRAVEAIATAFGAESAESRRVGPGVVEMVLAMRELLHQPTTAAVPSELETEAVTLGRRSDGSPWRLEDIDLDVTPHDFRRTVATQVARATTLANATALLGHADEMTTARHYVQRISVAPGLRMVIDQLVSQASEEASGSGKGVADTTKGPTSA